MGQQPDWTLALCPKVKWASCHLGCGLQQCEPRFGFPGQEWKLLCDPASSLLHPPVPPRPGPPLRCPVLSACSLSWVSEPWLLSWLPRLSQLGLLSSVPCSSLEDVEREPGTDRARSLCMCTCTCMCRCWHTWQRQRCMCLALCLLRSTMTECQMFE